MSISHFDEKSGSVPIETSFGRWTQTRGDVQVEIDVPQGTRAKDLTVVIRSKSIECSLKGTQKPLLLGSLFDTICVEESTWTLEDQRLLRVVLVKASLDGPLWEWLVDGQYGPDPLTYTRMRDKAELEKMQLEHPGFDFSGAELKKPLDDLPESILKQGSVDPSLHFQRFAE